MTRLIIELNHEFSAGPFLSLVEEGERFLNKYELVTMLDGSKPADFAISVALLSHEYVWPLVGFEFTPARLKKGGTFEYVIDDESMQARIKIHGTLSTSTLRSGVVSSIQKDVENAVFCLTDFIFKGGKWKGFEAPILGQMPDDFKNWFRIEKWSLK